MSDVTRTSAPEPDGPTAAATGDGGAGEEGDLASSPPGYELHALVGRGGMGSVYRARDIELAREVAVKILLPRYAPGSATARRFVDEAHITGRLQHPGIPAVYRVGALADGRPFLAMKLIDGRTLEEMLRDAPAAAESGPAHTPFEQGVDDRLAVVLRRGRLLAIFEQIAQAVGYAHQQDVIHRDLKPANVMVGAFGEVQVMDWGLARSGDRRPEGEPDGEPGGTVDYAPTADLTQAGAILGTPAFMPPEQAIGAVDRIGKHSDVFGLGAILCAILTGQPPFVAASAETARQTAARGKLDDAFARLDGCGAEPGLIALAKRCLAPEAGDRPRDAGEVANAVAVLRADTERRARQAELDRATAEVKVAEERKRRRVQRGLALAVLGLLAVTGYAARRIDNEQTRRRGEAEAQRVRTEAADAQRAAEARARQLATERDVGAALNEVQVLRDQGLKQADDPERWALTLVAARASFRRAESLLAAGEPGAEVTARLNDARHALAADDRDRALLAELDRIGEENDVRFLVPVPLTRRTSDRYAAAFRAHGTDLAAVPHADAVAWLTGHRFRAPLTAAVRTWQLSLLPFPTGPELAERAGPGAPPRPILRERLSAVLDAVTDDQFAREWWAALNRRDAAALTALLARPELGRLSSRELSSLADGMADLTPAGVGRAARTEFLRRAYDRFPGEFWVNFRLAADAEAGDKDQEAKSVRHLTAAVAARPRSAVARVALGSALWERQRDDPTGPRMVRAAADLDPASPWAHFFLGMIALEDEHFADALAAFTAAVRADADTAFVMLQPFLTQLPFTPANAAGKPPDAGGIGRILDGLVAARPDHPGGYELRGEFRLKTRDGRAALADYRTAKRLTRPDYPRNELATIQLELLEPLEKWGEKLPAVLRGDLRPSAAELIELAGFCATFERKYALAARFAGEALAADPDHYGRLKIADYAGWAVQAAAGNGTDAADLTAAERARLRRAALGWLREGTARTRKELLKLLVHELQYNPDLAPVRAGKEIRKLPPDEQDRWLAFWLELAPDSAAREVAPPPRPGK